MLVATESTVVILECTVQSSTAPIALALPAARGAINLAGDDDGAVVSCSNGAPRMLDGDLNLLISGGTVRRSCQFSWMYWHHISGLRSSCG